jgi:Cu/Ag efflux protein CusF
MSYLLKCRVALLTAAFALTSLGTVQSVSALDDLFHSVKGVVKSIDKDSKTMVVKAEDGTEHTIKWTDKTATEGGKDVGEGIAEGSKVSVKYTEKGGEKTATGVKDLGKSTEKVVH